MRGLIQETVAGKRGAGDEELQLLRHNFAVLAFAKHYLSLDSGATTPEEDYLFHFLGEGQGRRVLALARGEARDTLCVQTLDAPASPLDTGPKAPVGEALVARQGDTKVSSAPPPAARHCPGRGRLLLPARGADTGDGTDLGGLRGGVIRPIRAIEAIDTGRDRGLGDGAIGGSNRVVRAVAVDRNPR